MNDDKLVIGGKCVDILTGDIHVILRNLDMEYSLRTDDGFSFREDGKVWRDHEYPRFITLAEARRRGIIPKEPIIIEFESKILQHEWRETDKSFHTIGCIESHALDKYIKKQCKVRVEVLE